jgi:hypothetical protein
MVRISELATGMPLSFHEGDRGFDSVGRIDRSLDANPEGTAKLLNR